MKRRDFLKLAAAAAVSSRAMPLFGQVVSSAAATAPATAPHQQFDRYFIPIVEGFLRNARAPPPDYVVCVSPDATKLKSCCTPAGKTYVSVARMLPAMVEWLHAGRQPTRFKVGHADVELSDVMLSI